MRSKANIKSHPLHPILIVFPIAFLTGAFLSDILVVFTGRLFFARMTAYLEAGGILFGVIAAIPGVIDFFTIIPPDSSAMKRAIRHALLNFTVLFLFLMALLLRKTTTDFSIILLLELSGVVLLGIAGWLGGTLVHRNQIGIDHRYANAGKWKEETINSPGPIELKDLDSLAVNQMKLLKVNHKRIVIGHTESGFVAFDDHCSHRGGTLADGTLICDTVQCPWHGSQFNVQTGAVNAGPATEPVKTYKIEFLDQKYYLQL